jgi:hypothetical protein
MNYGRQLKAVFALPKARVEFFIRDLNNKTGSNYNFFEVLEDCPGIEVRTSVWGAAQEVMFLIGHIASYGEDVLVSSTTAVVPPIRVSSVNQDAKADVAVDPKLVERIKTLRHEELEQCAAQALFCLRAMIGSRNSCFDPTWTTQLSEASLDVFPKYADWIKPFHKLGIETLQKYDS